MMRSNAPDSYSPRHGFGSDSRQARGLDPAPYGPYEPKSKSTLIIVLATIGGMFLVGLVILGVLGFFVFSGLGLLSDQVAEAVSENPVILEHIGRIEAISMDKWASMEEPHPEVFVFRLKGSRGDGTLVAQSVTIDYDTEEVLWGILLLPGGESVPLFPDQPERPLESLR